jgi:2-polyprenyl-3-methyl-5-hydroxy-6-metoxy-1,4-benzoquinol methylase
MKPAEGAKAWEEIAEGWAERVRTGTDHNRVYLLDEATLEALGDLKGTRVLDAGCGEGRFARMMAERGARATGIDLSSRMIELARAEEEKSPLGIDYHVADMADLSALDSGTFDVAVAYLSLFDVHDYESAMREVCRVLKPRGRFVFSVSHPCFLTPNSGWETSVPNSFRDKDRLFYKVDDYFPATEIRFRMWPTAPTELINYHRPLSEYAHALKAAGFVIRDIFEPTPDAKLVEQLDFWRGYVRIAVFIMFECEKAST